MFVKTPRWKPINLKTCDISLHGGVPKQFYSVKDKEFGDWEIPPWELFIYQNELLGEGSFSKVYLAKWRETLVVAKVIDENICREKTRRLERLVLDQKKEKELDFNEIDERLLAGWYVCSGQRKRYLKSISKKK